MSKSVQEIIVERLIEKIEKDNKMPWQKPFKCGCINWATEKEYQGINRWLLDAGEYVTPNQLKKYNEKHDTSYWFSKGDPSEIVVYYGVNTKELTAEQKEKVDSNDIPRSWVGKLKLKNGELVLCNWLLRYYRVYDIKYVKDKEGNPLPPKKMNVFTESFMQPEDIITNYCNATGVRVFETSGDGAYYTESDDGVHLPPRGMFESLEAFYRTSFHELAHSTGIESRLNRECFKKYHNAKIERSREELIAEVSSMLLASEAGFVEETELGKNSENYIVGWVKWMKENTAEVVLGMQQAEKVNTYILNGGMLPAYTDELIPETVEI